MDTDPLSRNPVDVPTPSDKDPLEFESRLCGLSEMTVAELQRNDSRLKKIFEMLGERSTHNVNFDDKSNDYMVRENIRYKINPEESGHFWRLVVPAGMRKSVLDELHIRGILEYRGNAVTG